MNTASTTDSLYASYVSKMQQIADLKYTAAVLQWDQETYLPAKGAEARSRQLATISELAHKASTDKQLGTILKELASKELPFKQKRNVELSLEEYEKQKKYSTGFVRQLSETISKAFHSWMNGRKQNDFSSYVPELTELLDLKRKESDILGYENHPYNAHLKEYEKSADVVMLDKIFADLQEPLKALIDKGLLSTKVNLDFMQQDFPKNEQWDWGMYLLNELHFDFEAGRQDISEHPFTTNFSAQDVRITTRIDENDFRNMTWSCIHEVGHALYEQGLPAADYGLPSGEYASLSIHESQSRLWENCAGRSIEFWTHYYPVLQQRFFNQFRNVPLSHFVRAINNIQPSLIRTEADELTYHFHVMIRYEIEKDLLSNKLQVKDIKERWNSLYASYLNVEVPDDKRGCLQDVHWSHGSFGYFPTYSLGSFYAAQFFNTAGQQIENLNEQLTAGKTDDLLAWLRKNIHVHGKLYTSEELCKNITGEPLTVSYFLEYIENKITALNEL